MTEVVQSVRDTTNAPTQAALQFEMSSDLREALTRSMTDTGRRIIGEKALMLTSDRLVFANEDRLTALYDQKIEPLIERIGTSNVPIYDDVDVETVMTKYDAYRFRFTPADETRIALASLHKTMLNQLQADDRVLAHKVREGMTGDPGTLSLALPVEFFVSPKKTTMDRFVSARMQNAHAHGAKLTAHSPKLRIHGA